eukprot:COSAG02_NODE_7577_length_2952_cov_6.611987_3_plen_61_part_00
MKLRRCPRETAVHARLGATNDANAQDVIDGACIDRVPIRSIYPQHLCVLPVEEDSHSADT